MTDTRGAHVLPDVSIAFRERTCKHQSKRKSYKSSERRFNRLTASTGRPTTEKLPEVIGRREIAIIG